MFSFLLGAQKLSAAPCFPFFFSRKRRKKLFFSTSSTHAFFSSFFAVFLPPSLPSLAAFSGELKTRERERDRKVGGGGRRSFLFLPPSSSNKATLERRSAVSRLRLSVANFSSYLCPKSRQFPPLFFSQSAQSVVDVRRRRRSSYQPDEVA